MILSKEDNKILRWESSVYLENRLNSYINWAKSRGITIKKINDNIFIEHQEGVKDILTVIHNNNLFSYLPLSKQWTEIYIVDGNVFWYEVREHNTERKLDKKFKVYKDVMIL